MEKEQIWRLQNQINGIKTNIQTIKRKALLVKQSYERAEARAEENQQTIDTLLQALNDRRYSDIAKQAFFDRIPVETMSYDTNTKKVHSKKNTYTAYLVEIEKLETLLNQLQKEHAIAVRRFAL